MVRPPAQASTSPAGTTSPPVATPTTAAPRHPVAQARPASGLTQGQSVEVTGSGFTPGLSLVVVQCLARGTSTGSGDCNLAALVGTRADPTGRVAVHLTVSKGPFGNPPVLCSSTQRCLVSITEATLTPTEEADTPISFR